LLPDHYIWRNINKCFLFSVQYNLWSCDWNQLYALCSLYSTVLPIFMCARTHRRDTHSSSKYSENVILQECYTLTCYIASYMRPAKVAGRFASRLHILELYFWAIVAKKKRENSIL
jgi:hypothetical protein